jgi:stage V sporulation protein B
MLIGGLLKLAAVYFLTGNPDIGIVGTPVGTLLCYIAIAALNISSIRQLLEHPPAIVKNLLRPFLAALIMGVVVWGIQQGLYAVLGAPVGRGMTALIECALPIAAGAVVYVIAAVKLRAITREDCLLLPKGEKIAKLLHL